MTPLPPCPADPVMSEGQQCLPVTSIVCVCVCPRVRVHTFACMSVTRLDMGSVCTYLCVRLCTESVYALPPVLEFGKALITQSSAGLFLHGPGR